MNRPVEFTAYTFHLPSGFYTKIQPQPAQDKSTHLPSLSLLSRPVLILAPGAWHTPHLFHKIITKLESYGFTCVTVFFPSAGAKFPINNMSGDILAVRQTVLEQSEAGNDVVVVSHCWSGIPVNSALNGLSKRERAAAGNLGGVRKLLFISAFVLPEEVSVSDLVGSGSPLWDVQVRFPEARATD
jgi:hypothetical protein